MDEDTLKIIRTTPYIYDFLREESYHYKYLYRDKNYIKKINSLAKERYKLRTVDKLERLSTKLESIKTILDVLN